jgi:hypothetical protein
MEEGYDEREASELEMSKVIPVWIIIETDSYQICT